MDEISIYGLVLTLNDARLELALKPYSTQFG